MRSIIAVMLALIFLTFVLVGCSSTSEVNSTKATAELPSDIQPMVVMTTVCRSLTAIRGIMEGDKVSYQDAFEVLKYYIKKDLCRVYYPPIRGILEKKIDQYIDYDNKVTSVWKLKDEDLWTIVLNSSLDLLKKQSQSKGQET
jgi:hypothetical protein